MIDPSALCQIEIAVSDLERALHFYKSVFGWTAVPVDLHNYIPLQVPEDCPFGISLIPQEHMKSVPSGCTIYFGVEQPEDILSQVELAGGTLRFGPKKLPGYGEIAQFEDPDGQRWGLFRASGLKK